jgi:hypothetical protein
MELSRCLARQCLRHRDTRTAIETLGETMTERVSLKSLARLVLERDSARDNQRDTVSYTHLTASETPRQLHVCVARSDPVALQFVRVVPHTPGEPSLDQPCVARRGRIQELDGTFLHFCVECGRFGAFGCGVYLRKGRLGRWYCGEHRPPKCQL